MNLISQTTAILLTVTIAAISAFAQSTEFSYQGSLKDGATPANANYDFEFALFDTLSAGNQIGATIPKNSVPVANGIFAVKLDFGSVFPGANRFLEIRVRQSSGGGFTTLVPRQVVDSSPYSLKSLNADNASNATNATTATNASQLGGVAANQYVVTTDPRLSDARPPTAGSANYIQNTTSPQASSDFNISGNGTTGGTLAGNIVNTSTQYNIGGSRVLGISGTANLPDSNFFAGIGAGTNNAPNGLSGTANSFVGAKAGQANTTGFSNSFFGTFAGISNTTGGSNTFLGVEAGELNTTGGGNSFMGQDAGFNNSSGNSNSFLGMQAGFGNTTGSNNVMIGRATGAANVTGSNLTIIGFNTNVASNNLTFATAIGSGSVVSSNNTVVLGRGSDTVQVPGNLAVSGTLTATLPTGSGNYIQNTTSPQAASNFNISGNGIVGGNVGIGTTTTANLLTIGEPEVTNVAGRVGIFSTSGFNLLLRETTNDIEGMFGMNSGSGVFYGSTSSHNVQLRTNNTSRVTIDTAGNVGIGTGGPTERLHVNGNGLFTGNLTVNGTLNATLPAGSSNYIQNTASQQASSNFNISGNGIVGGNVGIGTAAPSEKLQVVGNGLFSGNVGIGTTAPANSLTIGVPETTVVNGRLGIFSPIGTNLIMRETTADVEGIMGVNSSNGVLYGSMTNHNVNIRTNNTTRIVIDTAGNVGVGTSSPAVKLDVVGSINLTGEVRRSDTGTANMLPLAYGHVLFDGTIASGSGNFSVTRVGSGGRYDISIPGEDFGTGANGYTVLVQIMNNSAAKIATTTTVSGNLVIILRQTNGNEASGDDFSILIFKP